MSSSNQASFDEVGREKHEWRWKLHAQQFHQAHGRADYAMIFSDFLRKAMLDGHANAQLRVFAGTLYHTWNHFSDTPVSHRPKVQMANGPTPDPRPLSQKELADLMGIAKSTFSDQVTFFREENYFDPHRDEVYIDDQRTPPLFAAQRAPRQRAALIKGKGPSSDSSDTFAFSSPQGVEKQKKWSETHSDLITELGEIEAEQTKLKARLKLLSSRRKAIGHARMKWVNAQLRKAATASQNRAASPSVSTAPQGNSEISSDPERELGSDSANPQFAGSQAAENPLAPVQTPRTESIRAPRTEVRTLRTNGELTSPESTANFGTCLNTSLTGERAQQQQQEPEPPSQPDVVVVAPDSEMAEQQRVFQAGVTYGAISLKTAGELLNECRRRRPGVTGADVATMIHQVASGFGRGVRNPIGLLLKEVPNHFDHFDQRPRSAQPPPADPERYLTLEYDQWRADWAQDSFDLLDEETKELLRRVKRKDLQAEERWRRIASDVQAREVDAAIMRDLAAKAPAFEQWRQSMPRSAEGAE